MVIIFLSLVITTASSLGKASTAPTPEFLVQGGKARAVIVVGDNASPFYRFVGQELERYLQAITGADLDIVTAGQAGKRPEPLLVLIGGPTANGLVERAVAKKQANFSDLKPDSFLLWQFAVGSKRGLIVGGNDEASTMYAAYDLLERLGVTFLLAKDILPEKTARFAVARRKHPGGNAVSPPGPVHFQHLSQPRNHEPGGSKGHARPDGETEDELPAILLVRTRAVDRFRLPRREQAAGGRDGEGNGVFDVALQLRIES